MTKDTFTEVKRPYSIDQAEVQVSGECEHGWGWTRVWDLTDECVTEIASALESFRMTVPAPLCEVMHEQKETPRSVLRRARKKSTTSTEGKA